MLPKKNRVSRQQFSEILRKSFVCHTPYFSLRCIKGTDSTSIPRAAVVVSKKVAMSAVKRNLLKRRARHVIQVILRKQKEGVATVLFYKKEALELSGAELIKQVELIYKEARLN